MAWYKVDDHFWGHPKRLACSLTEIGLWVTAGSWSAQQLTDGHIPTHVLAVFGAKPKDAAGLVRAGLWLVADGGWQFHDWHLYQPSRADVLKARDESAARKKAWRDKRAGQRAAGREGNADVPLGHVRDTSAAERPRDVDVPWDGRDCPTYPDPDPTRPDPDPIRSSLREEQQDQNTLLLDVVERPSAQARSSHFETFWQTYPRKVGKAAARKAYDRACKASSTEAVFAGLLRFIDDPTRDPAFTPHPATWLNQGRWEDEGPVRPLSNVRPISGRVAEGDAILREAYERGMAQHRPELGA